jgi:hypothetical protein
MGYQNRPPSSRNTWAYGYEIFPPMTQERLRAIEDLLEEEHASAKCHMRTWQARFVVQEKVTHILVVSDSSDQEMEVNRRVEAELARLEAVFSLTPPVPLGDGERPPFLTPGATPDT